ncbi:unnamed protein product [Prunus armeniaca]|uniref:Uncharacterized protein n=1 Tax=Prunus armeniaca TaxID=36596 RepID=A0A6J5W6A6_PRUAR|nr:unnamed protein product [Prunus armeniaca]
MLALLMEPNANEAEAAPAPLWRRQRVMHLFCGEKQGCMKLWVGMKLKLRVKMELKLRMNRKGKGIFRHLVDQVSSFDGTLLDIYQRTKDEETELVSWKGVRIKDCNGNIEALDEMVMNYFSVHGDIDACTLIYYTKLRNGFDKELSLEIERDVFMYSPI